MFLAGGIQPGWRFPVSKGRNPIRPPKTHSTIDCTSSFLNPGGGGLLSNGGDFITISP